MKTTSKVTIVHLGDSTTELGSPSRQILSLESNKQGMIFVALIVIFPQANYNPALLAIIKEEGLSAVAVSGNEVLFCSSIYSAL